MKKIATYFLSLLLVLAFSTSLASAKSDQPALPEIDGIYDVPGHPNLKLKVIVHKFKKAPAPQPTETCGLADPDSTAITPDFGYKLPSTWTYYLNSQSAPSIIGPANAVTLTGNAFRAWTDALGSKVAITYSGGTTVNKASLNGKNIITWGRTSGSALGITYIWFNTTTKYIAELDTIMNLKFTWYWSDPDQWITNIGTTCAYTGVYDAQDIMTHELGHWFGMDDVYTSEYAANTMYGYGSKGETKADTLTTGDIQGVQNLYN